MDGAEDSGREIGLKGRMRFEICGWISKRETDDQGRGSGYDRFRRG